MHKFVFLMSHNLTLITDNMMNSKQAILFMCFSCLCLLSAAQIKFVEGYIVNNNHKRIDCFIRNSSKAESTMNFEYKLKDGKKIEKIELSKIEEFGIGSEIKCIRGLISIDNSPTRIKQLKDTVNSPQWEEGHAYLKILVEGKLATLYSYYDEGKTLFFYSVAGSAIEPLFYKEYQLEITTGIVEQTLLNKAYLEQLKQHLSCGDPDELKKVSYTKQSLVKYFISYHKCKEADYVVPKSAEINKGIFKFKLGVNANNIKMSAQDLNNVLKINFLPENSIGFGAEAEYVLPFNNYKLSLFAESNYYSYYADYSDNALNSSHDGYVIDYKTIEVPIGINYYMNINQHHRLFVRGAFVPHYILGQSYISFNAPAHWPLAPSSRMFVGAGYNYRRIGLEFRFYTTQNITMNTYNAGSNLSQTSLRVWYTLFQTGKK